MSIERKRYLEKISSFIDKPVIKIITGMRRVGKSCFIKQVMSSLKKSGISDDRILYIDKEDIDFDFIQNYNDLNTHIKEYFKSVTEKKYIFIDEVQMIEHWEKIAASLHKKEDFDIYLTGSNAHLLSSELATLIAGRYVEITIYPLTYSETVLFYGDSFTSHDECFQNFIKYGGLPGIYHFEWTDETIFQYLGAIYNTVLLKDIVKRHNVRNVSLLEKIADFLFDNIGNLITANSISKFLKSQKITANHETVQNYLNYFTSSYLAYKVNRYDLKGKRVLETSEKYYVNDIGIRHSVRNYRRDDISQILENIVYMELLYRGYTVNIGTPESGEIDFIASKNNKKIYIQVTYLLASQKTVEREFKPLLEVKDNYPKYVLSMDGDIWGDDYQGVKRLNIMKFLTSEIE